MSVPYLKDFSSCNGCEACAEACLNDCIEVEFDEIAQRSLPLIDPLACSGCEACVRACVSKALAMQQE